MQLKHTSPFLVITAIFISSLITANIIAVKIVSILGFTLPAAIIVFPISYILGDVLTEVYGYKKARLVIWLGFGSNLLFIIFSSIAISLPNAVFWQNQTAFETILGQSPRILLASFLGFLIGSFSNSFILAKMKIVTKGKYLWTRTIGSTVVGEGFDSLIFILIAFIGTIPTNVLLVMVVTQWLIKVVYETVCTPLTYVVVRKLKQIEGVEVFDDKTNFNPILLKT